MTDVFFCNCSVFYDQDLFLTGMSLLSPFRQKKVNQSKSPQGKIQRLGAGVLLHLALQGRGLIEKEMEYRVEKNGKPYFANCTDLFFSLSHSEQWVACAIGHQEVGADIQVLSEYNARISKRCFSKEDAEKLAALKGREQNLEFTKLWAQKESVVKYYGTWNNQQMIPPISVYSHLTDAQIAICTYDIPRFHFITDIPEILSR